MLKNHWKVSDGVDNGFTIFKIYKCSKIEEYVYVSGIKIFR